MDTGAMVLTALKAGWTVSMNKSDELIFTKEKQKMTQEEHVEVISDGFSSKFLQSLIKKRVKD